MSHPFASSAKVTEVKHKSAMYMYYYVVLSELMSRITIHNSNIKDNGTVP